MSESLELNRTFDAPPDAVWRALTDPLAVPGWFWPFPTTADIDTRPGGRYRLSSSVMGMEGKVIDSDAPRALAFRWQWVGEDAQTEVRYALTPAGDGTRLRITHAGFANASTRDDHIQGWSDCLDRLPAWLTENEAG